MTDESRDDAASVAPTFCFSGSPESHPCRQPLCFEKHRAARATLLSIPRPRIQFPSSRCCGQSPIRPLTTGVRPVKTGLSPVRSGLSPVSAVLSRATRRKGTAARHPYGKRGTGDIRPRPTLTQPAGRSNAQPPPVQTAQRRNTQKNTQILPSKPHGFLLFVLPLQRRNGVR